MARCSHSGVRLSVAWWLCTYGCCTTHWHTATCLCMCISMVAQLCVRTSAPAVWFSWNWFSATARWWFVKLGFSTWTCPCWMRKRRWLYMYVWMCIHMWTSALIYDWEMRIFCSCYYLCQAEVKLIFCKMFVRGFHKEFLAVIIRTSLEREICFRFEIMPERTIFTTYNY